MKNLTTLLFILLGTYIALNAQSRTIESDTIIESDWIDGNWEPVSMYIATTNIKDSLIQLTYRPSSTGELEQVGRHTWIFNQNGNEERLITEFYFVDTDSYQNLSLIHI